ncbi:MAG: LysR family transcriptional regulator [Cytophagaceae bacterium]|nr:LysR family transcriptional regulator [Cytophagaceae bacterium]MBK9510866.1 LysR family transcriptional regulator [Cytophagaceae bacterium]MBK9934653.1 LysR family transcriptional regulator [Cytophagaceae bacterium]MBL0301090.1 LysR family transcriptional regulator [Cytophagaceae bacterium]MBL0323908.1 LysR family transcriptional regulator [Cytophagaceae bacterium]
MNLQQIEYILAVDKHRHFARAAEASFVTQPTLSMMIQKLEDELDVKIFDRSRQPVVPTEIGEKILAKARKVIYELEEFKNIVKTEKGIISGEIRLGVIPTIAPYLLPMFLQSFSKKYENLKLIISENVTDTILAKLKTGEIDAGIMVMPDDGENYHEYELYYEPFVVYSTRPFNKEYLLAEDIDTEELLLLEEGHCFRTQILKFCELTKQKNTRIEYSSGSLETLKNLTDKQLGITILPEMATLDFGPNERKKLKYFAEPQPYRKVSIITHRDFLKRRLISLLQEGILEQVPEKFKKQSGQEISFSRKT